MGMQRFAGVLLGLALALSAGCSSTPTPTPQPIFAPEKTAITTARRLLDESGLRWDDSPSVLMAELMTYEHANTRLGGSGLEGNPTPALTTVWLVAFSGRYRILPQLPGYETLGPYKGCVHVMFDTAHRVMSLGDGCPGPLLTPIPTARPMPTFTATHLASATPRPTATSVPTATAAFWAVQAPDFGFRFEDLSCYNDVLDTVAGTFSTDVDHDPEPISVTVTMQLSDEQMAAVYQKILEIRFWDYPANFAVPLPPFGQGRYVFPQSHFRFTVRNGGVEQSVDWLIEYFEPTNQQAQELLGLYHMLWELIRSHPAYEQVPEHGYGCL